MTSTVNVEQALLPCPFCKAVLLEPTPVHHPKTGLARLHPGAVTDDDCPLSGWGFYDHQLAAWNQRAALTPATLSASGQPADLAGRARDLLVAETIPLRTYSAREPLYPESVVLRAIEAAITAAQAKIARLSDALEKCAEQFEFYAREHGAAGKIEKANTNLAYAGIARAAISSPDRIAEWQGIESAPRDGSIIIGARFVRDELKWVKDVRWASAEDIAEYWNGGDPDDYQAGWDCEGNEIDPTHWLNWPTPPRTVRDEG